jgi:hypothetical protein
MDRGQIARDQVVVTKAGALPWAGTTVAVSAKVEHDDAPPAVDQESRDAGPAGSGKLAPACHQRVRQHRSPDRVLFRFVHVGA